MPSMVCIKPPLHNPSPSDYSSRITKKAAKKTTVACIQCRKRKIKCSSDRPACVTCLRRNVPCEYPVIRNRGSRWGYREMLERRLSQLAKYCDSSGNSPSMATFSHKESKDAAPELGNIPDVKWPESIIPDKELDPIDNSYPNMSLVLHLVEVYFENINSQTYSFLHPPSFLTRLEKRQVSPLLVYAICALSARFSKHPDVVDKCHNSRLYLAGEEYLQKARKLLSQEFDTPSLETVQAVICLVQHEFFRTKGGKSMIYIAMAFPMALQLGLDKNPPINISFVEQESRRRTFWSLVVLDRLGHATPLYSLQLNADLFRSLSVPCQAHRFFGNIPTKTPSFDTPQEIATTQYDQPGIFSYHIEGTLLWNRANVFSLQYKKGQSLNMKEFHDIVKAVDHFEMTLPARFRYSYSTLEELTVMRRVGHYVHIHIELQATKFLLYKNLCGQKEEETLEEKKVRENAINEVITAANKVSSILQDMSKIGDNMPIAPFVGYCIFLVSSVQIVLSFSPDKEKAALAEQYLAINLKFLIDLREYWYIVGVWCVILKDRYSVIRSKHINQPESNENDKDFTISRPPTPPPYLPDEYLDPSTRQQPNTPKSLEDDKEIESSIRSTPLDHYLDDTLGYQWLEEVESNPNFVMFDYEAPTHFNIQKEASILDHILDTVM